MDILHGWNAHFQDDILTVREDDGISILRWMFVSLIFNNVVFQLHGTQGTTREDIYTQVVSGKNAHIQRECGPELTDYLFNVTKKDQVDHVNTISKNNCPY